jgi:ABC-type dipeptide/oligopeptide/nickel transport system permease subunit
LARSEKHFGHYAVFSSLLLLPLFQVNIFSLGLVLERSSHNLRDKVSHPYRTTGTVIVLCVLMLALLGSRQEGRL